MIARAVPWLLVAMGVFTAWSIAGMQIVAGLLLLAFLATGGWREARAIRDPVLAFAAACLASALLSDAPWRAFEVTAWKPVLMVWIVAALVARAGAPATGRAARAWLLAAALAGAWGVVQAFTGWDLLAILHLRRAPIVIPLASGITHVAATGFFNSRLTFANALVVTLGIAGAWALRERGRARAWAALAAAIMAAGLLLSFGRAAWWGAAVAAGTLIVITRSRGAALAAGAGLALALALPQVRARVVSSVLVSKNEDRVFIWDRAREVIMDHPVLGVGFAAYPQVAAPYYDRANPAFPMHTWAHDTPLSLLAEVGPLGLCLYLWLWLSVYALGLSAVRGGSTLAMGLFAGTVGLHVTSLFHDVLYDGEVAYALYFGAALLAGLGMLARGTGTKEKNAP